ncbi:hypothetical protein [Leptospira santarosai]|uniref:hypothetical protein n=1 Tax=Leptospira santarosai TaxID=28183 RepID=UPI000774E583|nr:hypothetical protein [Leptospira santarosai]
MTRIISFLLFLFLITSITAEANSVVVDFKTDQEYKDFCYSLKPVLTYVYKDITMDWIVKSTIRGVVDLNAILKLANKEYKQNSENAFVKNDLSNIKELIKSSLDNGLPVLAKRKLLKQDQGKWIVIIGHVDKTIDKLVMNDSRVAPFQEILTKEIEAVYILK